jgi:hypothetical protein
VPQADGQPFTFFIDRSLGSGTGATALREAGEVVITHDTVFEPDTADVTWLAEVGKRGWLVLTKDARIRTNHLEREALFSSDVAAFMLGRGDLRGADMAAAFVKALPRMKTALRRWKRPLIAAVLADGGVTVQYADGQKLPKARVVK